MNCVDCRDLEVTCGDSAAIEGLERAHECLLVYDGDPVGTIDQVLSAQPDFIMGHCFKAAVLTQTMETRIYDDMLGAVEAAERLQDKASDRERGHIAAVRAWVDGDFSGAQARWEEVLTYHPFDLLAMQLGHLTAVLLGDVAAQRDIVARVFPMWDESVPGYEFVLGFYAFGLEENRDFMHAEELARQSLAMRLDNPYAVHAVAHVMEMKGRQRGGISFMDHALKHWENTHFANHLWWHYTLFCLDLGRADRVLEVYDHNLRSQDQSGDKYEELDAAAILWRLKLLDIDVGDRWPELADKWERSAADTLYAFNDVHAMMAFVSDNRVEAANNLLHANARYVKHASDANAAMSREIGLPFCLALQDFAQGKYGSCVDRLLPIRYMTHRLGGSAAQRDIVGWTLLESAMRARRFELALALANERCERKASSAQNWKYVARALKGLGRHDRANWAESRCESLLAA
ncbi:MAG: tetratricopeptide repeat protein [Gammaproteobacteria bacterium]